MSTLSYQNYKVEIPADIANLVRRRNRKRIISCVIGLCVVIATLIYAWSIPNLNQKNYLAFGLVFLILPFLISGVPFQLFDRCCCGEIVDIRIKTEQRFEQHPFSKRFCFMNVVYVKLRLENGKLVKKTAYVEWANAKVKRLDMLQKGDIVVYISGMNFVQRISDDAQKDNFCVVCGALRPSKEEKCYNCGHTLNFKESQEKNETDLWWDSHSDFHT